jgi:DNA-binding MarR family transcriptional regulator
MLDKMSDASRIVDRLQKRGLVRKALNDDDRRLVNVQITEEGLTMVNHLKKMETALDAMTRGLSKAEAAELNRLLDKMRDNFHGE